MSLSQAKNGLSVLVDSDLKKVAHAEIKSDSLDCSVVIFFYLKVTNFFLFIPRQRLCPKVFPEKLKIIIKTNLCLCSGFVRLFLFR